MSQQGGARQWVNVLLKTGTSGNKKDSLGILFMFWWNLWKERNRCIFDQEEKSALQTARLILDEIRQFKLASVL
jgi:hypothetical protein